MSTQDWGGYRLTRGPECVALYIGPLPERKRIAMYVVRGAEARALAWFTDEAAAREALGIIDRIVNGRRLANGL